MHTIMVIKTQMMHEMALTIRSLTGRIEGSSNENWLVGQVWQSYRQGVVGAWKMGPSV